MMQNSLVTIIVPVYNSQDTVEKCILSLVEQTYTHIEIILIDDGSSDNSYELCIKYMNKDKRIRVLHHDNHGVSYTRNVGIDNAKGDYMMFVDADDIVLPDMVEQYLYVAVNSSADVVIGGLIFVDENRRREIYPPENSSSAESILNTVIQNHSGVLGYVCNKMYYTDIIKKHNIVFPEQLSIQEDLVFFLEVLDYVQVIIPIQYAGYEYLIHSKNSTVDYDALIANQVRIIQSASRYSGIDVSPAQRWIGNLLTDRLMSLGKNLNTELLKKYIDDQSIQNCLNHKLMHNKNRRIIVWLVKHKAILLLYLYLRMKL